MISPINCIQETLPFGQHYPWRVMVSCVLLNRTQRNQVRPILDKVWEMLPTPDALLHMTDKQENDLHVLLAPLGLINRRYDILIRMTIDYLEGKELHKCFGLGKYGRDAVDLFVLGRTDVHPHDTWLKPYLKWRLAGGPPVQWKTK